MDIIDSSQQSAATTYVHKYVLMYTFVVLLLYEF